MVTKIYQIKNISEVNYAFRDYNSQLFSFSDYELVAQLETSDALDETMLEFLFREGNNGQLQKTFPNMRSLSVSDVIEIEDRKYYINNIGYKVIK